MPYIHVQMIEDGNTDAQKAALIEGITQVFVDVLERRADGVWVVIDEIPQKNWGIGGQSIAARRGAAAS
jgi:4-oxalocrotonate tautomerase